MKNNNTYTNGNTNFVVVGTNPVKTKTLNGKPNKTSKNCVKVKNGTSIKRNGKKRKIKKASILKAVFRYIAKEIKNNLSSYNYTRRNINSLCHKGLPAKIFFTNMFCTFVHKCINHAVFGLAVCSLTNVDIKYAGIYVIVRSIMFISSITRACVDELFR